MHAVSRRIVKTITNDGNASAAKRDDDRLKDNGNKDAIVIYNRIPKTGSTSFVNVAYDLCKRNSFNVIHLNVTKNSHTLSLSDQVRIIRRLQLWSICKCAQLIGVWLFQVRLVHNISNWNAKKPALYHGHVGFIDFEKWVAMGDMHLVHKIHVLHYVRTCVTLQIRSEKPYLREFTAEASR